MALDGHPHAFRFEGRWWVSTEPAEIAYAAIVEQRRWDAAHVRSQRWTWALAIGAVVGTAATLGLGTLAGLSPAIYLVLLPLGFGAGAVVGAVINRRILGNRLLESTDGPRPTVPELVRVPPAVVRYTTAQTPVDDVVSWSREGFVPRQSRPE